MRYVSTKTYGHDIGLSACFRQWRAESHCRYLHGYALAVHLEFEATSLDARNWVVDFGSLKPIKQWLQDRLDHKTLVARDDPELRTFRNLHDQGLLDLVEVDATGCEAFAAMIFDYVQSWLQLCTPGQSSRVRLRRVEVREHGANSAMVEP